MRTELSSGVLYDAVATHRQKTINLRLNVTTECQNKFTRVPGERFLSPPSYELRAHKPRNYFWLPGLSSEVDDKILKVRSILIFLAGPELWNERGWI